MSVQVRLKSSLVCVPIGDICSCHDLSDTLVHSKHVLFLLQFAVFLWVLTYVGAWFNGLTMLILGKVTESLSLHSVHSCLIMGCSSELLIIDEP